jgi:hypothetical protein
MLKLRRLLALSVAALGFIQPTNMIWRSPCENRIQLHALSEYSEFPGAQSIKPATRRSIHHGPNHSPLDLYSVPGLKTGAELDRDLGNVRGQSGAVKQMKKLNWKGMNINFLRSQIHVQPPCNWLFKPSTYL